MTRLSLCAKVNTLAETTQGTVKKKKRKEKTDGAPSLRVST